jgi:uncharacterized protein (UPF0332 family)
VSPRSVEFLEAARRRPWHEFRTTFVTDGTIDAELAAEVQKIQPEREQADYDAWSAPTAEAQRAIELAHRFLAAIEALLD